MTEMDEELMLRSIAEYKREMSQPVRTHQMHPLIQEKPLVLKAIKSPPPRKLRMPPRISTKVINAASQVFGVPVDRILCPQHDRPYVRCRQAISLILKGEGYSQIRIASLLKRHHTTIMYEIITGQEHLEANAAFRASVEQVMALTTRKKSAAPPESILSDCGVA